MVGTRSQRIPLNSLTALTLHSSRKTTSRRTSPIPQLTCQGKACRTYKPDVVQCVKVGEDGAGGLEWKCEAELPKGVRFGAVEVGCEGWDGPGDPYILRGSCGLTYDLIRTSSLLEDSSYSSSRIPSGLSSYFSNPSAIFDSAFSLVFGLLTLYLVFSLLRKLLPSLSTLRRFFGLEPPPPGGRPPRPPGGGGGWRGSGGGGPGGPSDPPPPPPPYTPKPEFASPAPEVPTTTGWRPGVWTGLAAGWAANAFLQNAGGGRQREREYMWEREREARRREEMLGGGGGFWGGGNRGLFGGGVGGGYEAPRQRGGWGFGGGGSGGVGASGSGSASGSSGGGMRRSTGFGGTNVR